MTVEQLEELLWKVADGGVDGFYAKDEIRAVAPSLARRVIAAEKLVEAGRAMANDAEHGFVTGRSIASWDAAETAYREASK